jgi:predicted Zn-ribbon and HTH transcriptional regulator
MNNLVMMLSYTDGKKILQSYESLANPSGRVVYSECLWPIACWDCGFESRRGHECLSVVSVVCCQVEVSAMG